MIMRMFSLLMIIMASIIDPSLIMFIVKPEVQLVLGTIIIAIILFNDPTSGLLLAVAILIAYSRVYSTKYGVSLFSKKELKEGYPMKSLVSEYITPQNLEDAQNNIVNDESYKLEVKGITGVYGEQVYGAQGTDKNMPGYQSFNLLGNN